MSAVAQSLLSPDRRSAFAASRVHDYSSCSDLEAAYSALGITEQHLYRPAFFLSTISPRRWNPEVVLVKNRQEEHIGILYAKERKLFGLRTGLVFADATLGSMVSAKTEDLEDAFFAGMKALLHEKRVRAIRLLAPPSGHEVRLLKWLAGENGFEFRTANTENHLILPLTNGYETFLAGLGSRTRRNFRYYRRGSDNAGQMYLANLSLEQFSRAAWTLEGLSPIGAHAAGLQRALKMFGAARKPLLVGLKSADGKILSLIGGWHEADRVVVFMQLNNDQAYAKFSLSLVIRSHLIENLILNGYREIVWWAGVGEPISNYCIKLPSLWVCLDRSDAVWLGVRRLINRNRHRLPGRLRSIADWVEPQESS